MMPLVSLAGSRGIGPRSGPLLIAPKVAPFGSREGAMPRGGQLIFDAPVIVQFYTAEPALEENADDLRSFLVRLGKEGRQGAVGLVIDRDYLEIRFPLEEA